MIQGVWRESIDFHSQKRIEIENSGGFRLLGGLAIVDLSATLK